jgi:hypothetical protein
MSDVEGSDRRSDLAVMEANEYKQKRRLERIMDAHDAVEELAAEAFHAWVEGDITDDGKNIILLHGVKQFIREIYNLLWEHLNSLEDGERSKYWHGEEDTPLGVINRESDQPVVFYGLRDVLAADRFYIETVEKQVGTRHGPDQTKTVQKEHTVPEQVSWRAYLLGKQFLDEENDIEVKFEKMDNRLSSFGFDTIDVSGVDAQNIEKIEDYVEGGVDARAMNGGDGDE